jgi:hypothetical protein
MLIIEDPTVTEIWNSNTSAVPLLKFVSKVSHVYLYPYPFF